MGGRKRGKRERGARKRPGRAIITFHDGAEWVSLKLGRKKMNTLLRRLFMAVVADTEMNETASTGAPTVGPQYPQ